MTKKEFLDELAECLAGNVTSDIIDENIRYYRAYIENSEKSEQEVLEELGAPQLIARTIIDKFMADKGPMADYYVKQARDEYSNSRESAYDAGGAEEFQSFFDDFKNKSLLEKIKTIIVLAVSILLLVVVVAVVIKVLIGVGLVVLGIVAIVAVIGLIGMLFRRT